MFGFFKNSGMGSALDECQGYHKRIGLDQELTQIELNEVKSLPLFKDIDSKYKSRGLTKYGALAWFTLQTTGNILQALNDGNSFRKEALTVIEKLTFVSLAIGNSIPELRLTKADMAPIESACRVAGEWLKRHQPLLDEISALDLTK